MTRAVPMLIAALLTTQGLVGCWWLRQAAPSADPPGSRLAAWRLTRIGVVELADATRQGVGQRVTAAIGQALMTRLGAGRVVLVPTSPADVGLIGIGQAQRLGRTHRVDGLLSGQVLAWQWQRRHARVWVTVALRLLDANRGSIIWSRTVTGAAAVQEPSTPRLDAGFDDATGRAAKEFIDDLLATPPQAGAPRGPGADGDRRPS